MQFKYNWDNNLQIKDILTTLYQNSLNELSELDSNYAKNFINDLEDFIYCIIAFRYDLERVISALKQIKSISFQDETDKDRHILTLNYIAPPKVIIKNGKILLSREIKENRHLTLRETQKLYLFHGLCQKILNLKNEKTIAFSKTYHEILKDTPNGRQIENLVANGWLLLEHAISQEIAETFVYSLASKSRPAPLYGVEDNDHLIIDSTKVLSNYDSFRIFQPILIMFGWTISNVGNQSSHDYYQIKYDIVKKAINEDFSESVLAEYISKKQEFELFQLLYLMGLLANAKYTSFGINLVEGVSTTKEENNKAFEGIRQLKTTLATLSETKYEEKISLPEHPKNDITKRKILQLAKTKEPYLTLYPR